MTPEFEPIDPETDKVANQVVNAAFQVHQTLGPGLLENAYELCFAHELGQLGLKVERQVPVPLIYKNVEIPIGFRMDLLVDGTIVLEIKAVESLQPIHEAQLLTYLRLSKKRLGFLVNFNEVIFKKCIRRIAL